MTDRWEDDPVRGPRGRGRLAEVRDARVRLEAAIALLGGELDDWMRRRQESIADGARKGLDASMSMAMLDQASIPREAIADAGRVDLKLLDVLWARLHP